MPVNPTLFWIASAGALTFVAIRLLGIEGAVLVALVWIVFHFLRPGKHSSQSSSQPSPERLELGDQLPPEPITVELGDELDLHAFAPQDSKDLVLNYLGEAAAKGFRQVRIIHGKGKGVQREMVRKILSTHALVESYGNAPLERGSWGATVVKLRKISELKQQSSNKPE